MFLAVLLVLSCSFQQAAAQFLQNLDPTRLLNRSNGQFYNGYRYRPDPQSLFRNVADLSVEGEVVYLMYNCHYMTNICDNVRNFYATSRGQNLHPGTALDKETFAFDFHGGDRKDARKTARRKRSCPSGRWKRIHPCPESGQKPVWRQDGEWWTNALEPGSRYNVIKHQRDGAGNIAKYSGLSYSCDEFPPASWIEGGNGWGGSQPAETRCAGQSCTARIARAGWATGVKSEQDWQGKSHKLLRALLQDRIEDYPNQFPSFNFHQDVALFKFGIADLGPTGKAAFVYVSNKWDLYDFNYSYVTQARRRDEGTASLEADGGLTRTPWPRGGPSVEEALKLMLAGHGHYYAVPAYGNESVVASPSGPGLEELGLESPGLGGLGVGDTATHVSDLASVNLTSPDIPWSRRDLVNPHVEPRRPWPIPRRQTDASDDAKPLLRAASSDDLEHARAIVAEAIAASGKLNAARMAKPARNQYRLKPGTVVGSTRVKRRHLSARDELPVTPLLEITDEIARAAALVAEADALAPQDGARFAPKPAGLNQTSLGAGFNLTRRADAKGSYWMESIARKGTVPWGDDPSYKVFRNVLDYGAVGNGVTDDTEAIKKAMNDGKRCGEKCNGSTLKNAIVYFPPGTYLISSTIPMPFGTQVIGDAIDRPVLVASPSFVGLGILSTDEYTGGGTGPDGGDQQWYVNTANFYRQIRNVILDIRPAPAGESTACLHYQVAQATSMQNVELRAGPGQKGIYAENGSGGQISDVTFKGGDVCLFGGEQQFTAQRLVFDGCTVGVQVIWDWGWVWKSITMTNVGTGFKFVPNVDGSGSIGSSAITDSSFTGVGTVVVISPPSEEPGSSTTGIVLENVAMSGVDSAVSDTNGRSLLAPLPLIDQWVLGPVYSGSADASSRSWSSGGKVGRYRRQAGLLDGKGAYFERPKPQYEDRGVGDFMHVKDFGATGDGSTDDTDAFQRALYGSQGKILFVDAGSYILTRTVTVPTGVKIVGETWSQLVVLQASWLGGFLAGRFGGSTSRQQCWNKVGRFVCCFCRLPSRPLYERSSRPFLYPLSS